MSADADRIATLTAELAEARGLPRQCAALGHTQKVGGFCAECNPHKTPMECLDAAQERASAKRAAHDRTLAELADSRLATLMRASERDAALAEVAAMFDVLRGHYLAGIECDHEANTDRALCACSRVDLGHQPNVGTAVETWIEHVRAAIGTAGRAVATRVSLLEAVATAARNYREMYGPSPSSHDTGPEELDTTIYALDRAK